MAFLNKGKPNKASLAAKWFPSLGSSFHRSNLLCETIVKRVFPRERCPEHKGTDQRGALSFTESVICFGMRLRKVLELPKIHIGQNSDLCLSRSSLVNSPPPSTVLPEAMPSY